MFLPIGFLCFESLNLSFLDFCSFDFFLLFWLFHIQDIWIRIWMINCLPFLIINFLRFLILFNLFSKYCFRFFPIPRTTNKILYFFMNVSSKLSWFLSPLSFSRFEFHNFTFLKYSFLDFFDLFISHVWIWIRMMFTFKCWS